MIIAFTRYQYTLLIFKHGINICSVQNSHRTINQAHQFSSRTSWTYMCAMYDIEVFHIKCILGTIWKIDSLFICCCPLLLTLNTEGLRAKIIPATRTAIYTCIIHFFFIGTYRCNARYVQFNEVLCP